MVMFKLSKYFYFIFLIGNLICSKLSAHTPPVPDFSIINACYGDSTKFINQSIGGIYSMWVIKKWNAVLNDTISIDTLHTTNLTYLFPSQGTYYIMLQENNGHIVSITREIIIGTITKAKFNFQNCTNQFLNMSTCASLFLWKFGDGTTSSLPSPIHQYADTGTYVVTLIVYNGVASDTLTKSIKIASIGYPNPTFTVTLSNDTVYCKVTGGVWSANNLTWYFSDGTSATSANAFHVFQDTGTYNVRLRVINGCGMFMKDTLVTVNYLITAINNLQSTKSNSIIYPNPSKNIITVSTDIKDPIEFISIYDVFGQKVMQVKSSDKHQTIDINQLNGGSYILRIKTETNFYYNKFIKE